MTDLQTPTLDTYMGSLLAQEQEGYEWSIYYLSRALTDTKTRYFAIEKLGFF